MKITIKAIIRWEQMTNKSFAELNVTDNDDLITLLYVCEHCNEVTISLDEFKQKIEKSPKKIVKMFEEFEKKVALFSQFQNNIDKAPEQEEEQSEPQKPIYIKDIVPLLILNGLDAHFAYNEMEICDVPLFINANEERKKDMMVMQRLWTFLQLAPHLKDGVTPTEFYPFPWEKKSEKSKEEREQELKEARMFFGQGLNKR